MVHRITLNSYAETATAESLLCHGLWNARIPIDELHAAKCKQDQLDAIFDSRHLSWSSHNGQLSTVQLHELQSTTEYSSHPRVTLLLLRRPDPTKADPAPLN